MRLVNLTRHPLRLFDPTGSTVLLEVEPSEPPATYEVRVRGGSIDVGDVRVPVVAHEFHGVRCLPAPREGTTFVVPWGVLQALAQAGEERDDLLATDTTRSSVVRDQAGRIVGVRALRRWTGA